MLLGLSELVSQLFMQSYNGSYQKELKAVTIVMLLYYAEVKH